MRQLKHYSCLVETGRTGLEAGSTALRKAPVGAECGAKRKARPAAGVWSGDSRERRAILCVKAADLRPKPRSYCEASWLTARFSAHFNIKSSGRGTTGSAGTRHLGYVSRGGLRTAAG